MNLADYFLDKKGIGVLATSDKAGMVDAAIYSRPHMEGGETVAFVMRDRLTHKNLQENDHACYLFLEEGRGYYGIRMFLTKTEETTDDALIAALTRRHLTLEEDKAKGEKFLVRFRVDRVLSLIGGEELAFR